MKIHICSNFKEVKLKLPILAKIYSKTSVNPAETIVMIIELYATTLCFIHIGSTS